MDQFGGREILRDFAAAGAIFRTHVAASSPRPAVDAAGDRGDRDALLSRGRVVDGPSRPRGGTRHRTAYRAATGAAARQRTGQIPAAADRAERIWRPARCADRRHRCGRGAAARPEAGAACRADRRGGDLCDRRARADRRGIERGDAEQLRRARLSFSSLFPDGDAQRGVGIFRAGQRQRPARAVHGAADRRRARAARRGGGKGGVRGGGARLGQRSRRDVAERCARHRAGYDRPARAVAHALPAVAGDARRDPGQRAVRRRTAAADVFPAWRRSDPVDGGDNARRTRLATGAHGVDRTCAARGDRAGAAGHRDAGAGAGAAGRVAGVARDPRGARRGGARGTEGSGRRAHCRAQRRDGAPRRRRPALSIARDIMVQFEGSLQIVASPLGGTAFVATVRRA